MFSVLLLMSAPAVLVTLLYAGARVGVRRKPTANRKAIRAGLGVACLAFWAFDLFLCFSILQGNWVAPAFLITHGPIVWFGGLAVGWSGATAVYTARARREGALEVGARIRAAIAVAIMVLAFGYAGVRGYSRVLEHRATSAQTAEELNALYNRFGVRHDGAVLEAIAENRSSSSELLRKLSTDEHWRVRSVVARRRHTQPEALRQMYENDSSLPSLAMNPNTPVDVLERLLGDSTPGVQHNLAGNRSATDSMLAVLAENPDKFVHERARNQQRSRASRKRRGCLEGDKPTPVRHEGSLPTLDEIVEAHKQQTGLDYAVCPDGYDYRIDNVWVVQEHRACIEEARKTCKPTEYRGFNTAQDPGFLSFATFIEPREDGRCGTVVILDAREDPSTTGCRIVKTTDCHVVEEWGCPRR